MRALLLRGSVVCLLPLLAFACGGADAEAEIGGANTGAQDAAPPPPPPPPPTVDAGPAAPPPAPVDAGPPPAAALDPVAQADLAKALEARVGKEARWPAKPLGTPFGGVLGAGQVVEQTIMINSQKCYSVLAQGGLGVTDVEVTITAIPPKVGVLPLPSTTFAVDSTTGPNASVSPCVKNVWPLSFEGRITIKATGSGPVLAQVFVQ